jgi:tRNA 2-thiouridine synthesizing protein E
MNARTNDATTMESLHAKIDALTTQVAYLAERQRKTEELFEEATPILKEVLGTATRELDAMEKKGYFAFGRELVRVGERILDGFEPDDVRQLGGAVVGILETVRALTQPEVLKVAGDAAVVVQNAEKAQPIGIMGMVRATGDHDVQKGMAVLMEVMRHVGRASAIVSEQRATRPLAQKRAKLDAVLGPRRKALGTERTRPAGMPPPSTAMAKKAPTEAHDSCAVPNKPQAVAATIDGISFSADGHMTDASQWTREVGLQLAAMQGVELTDAHWKVLDAARADFDATKTSPNIRRLTQLMGVSTKDLYTLFPKAPGRTIAKVAGLPKPAGCL